eukprot:6033250-Ditylum_brightwellii.AAC.1
MKKWKLSQDTCMLLAMEGEEVKEDGGKEQWRRAPITSSYFSSKAERESVSKNGLRAVLSFPAAAAAAATCFLLLLEGEMIECSVNYPVGGASFDHKQQSSLKKITPEKRKGKMAGNMEGDNIAMTPHHRITPPQASGVSTNKKAKEEDTA